ncbi:MAG: hypothetical protein AMXMBFR56_72840 [Polyangiaceae bacterium]
MSWTLKTSFGDELRLEAFGGNASAHVLVKSRDSASNGPPAVVALSPADCRALALELRAAATRLETRGTGHHVVLDQTACESRCTHCGSHVKWTQDDPTPVILDRLVAFMREHRECEPASEDELR